jgi:hypothetical protein
VRNHEQGRGRAQPLNNETHGVTSNCVDYSQSRAELLRPKTSSSALQWH